MKLIFLFLIFIHGVIHLLGFAKAFNLATVNQLSQNISMTNGLLWLVAAILFIASTFLFFLKKDSWWLLSVFAIIISQYLIFTGWHDAKFGTIANVIILLVAVIRYGTWSFGNKYKNEVITLLNKTASVPDSLLTEMDIQSLPGPVQKYLRYTGAVGKPKIKNFRVEFMGQFRKNKQSEWMPFRAEQHSFLNSSVRLFFMNATMKHLPVAGFHCFKNGDAFMDIRLLSLFKVQYQAGKEAGIAETVTFFNDMCCMAPASLIDKRIKWTGGDSNNVKAEFTNNGTTISACLYFNDKGELVNFISDDRYAVTENNTMKQLRWSTPLKDNKESNGYKLASYADVIYSYPEGDFCYGNFNPTNIEYNCIKYK